MKAAGSPGGLIRSVETPEILGSCLKMLPPQSSACASRVLPSVALVLQQAQPLVPGSSAEFGKAACRRRQVIAAGGVCKDWPMTSCVI